MNRSIMIMMMFVSNFSLNIPHYYRILIVWASIAGGQGIHSPSIHIIEPSGLNILSTMPHKHSNSFIAVALLEQTHLIPVQKNSLYEIQVKSP
jgi:hypothetical protein